MSVLYRIFCLFSSKRWRILQRVTGVHRVHHPRWSFGWSLPFTTWCRFETCWRRDFTGHGMVRHVPGWQRCERTSYHDSTKTGTY